MKALVATKPGELSLEERPIPKIGENEVLLRTKIAAICHTDFYIIEGRHVPPVRYPVVPGHEFSGVVKACGSGVKYLKPGFRVTAGSIIHCGYCNSCRVGKTNFCLNRDLAGFFRDAGFEEYVAVPVSIVHRISDSLSFEEASLAEPAACAYSAVVNSEIKFRDRVLIIGPGPMGLLALQFAKLYHPRCLILAGTRKERLSLGKSVGATHTINVNQGKADDLIKEITEGRGPNIVIQCAGTKSAVELALKVASSDSTIAFEGTTGSKESISIPIDDFVNKAWRLKGINGFTQQEYTKALEIMEAGLIELRSLVTHTFSLEQYKFAFDTARNRREGAIKVAFRL